MTIQKAYLNLTDKEGNYKDYAALFDRRCDDGETQTGDITSSAFSAQTTAVSMRGNTQKINGLWQCLSDIDEKYNPLESFANTFSRDQIVLYFENGEVPDVLQESLPNSFTKIGGGFVFTLDEATDELNKFIKAVSDKYVPKGSDRFATAQDLQDHPILREIYTNVFATYKNKFDESSHAWVNLNHQVTHETSGWGTLGSVAVPMGSAVLAGAVLGSFFGPLGTAAGIAIGGALATYASQRVFEGRSSSELQWSWIALAALPVPESAVVGKLAQGAKALRFGAFFERVGNTLRALWKPFSVAGNGAGKVLKPVVQFGGKVLKVVAMPVVKPVQWLAKTQVGKLVLENPVSKAVSGFTKRRVVNPVKAFVGRVGELKNEGKLLRATGTWIGKSMLSMLVHAKTGGLSMIIGFISPKTSAKITAWIGRRVWTPLATKAWPPAKKFVVEKAVAIVEKAAPYAKFAGHNVVLDGAQMGVAAALDENGDKPLLSPFTAEYWAQNGVMKMAGLVGVNMLARGRIDDRWARNFIGRNGESWLVSQKKLGRAAGIILDSSERELNAFKKAADRLNSGKVPSEEMGAVAESCAQKADQIRRNIEVMERMRQEGNLADNKSRTRLDQIKRELDSLLNPTASSGTQASTAEVLPTGRAALYFDEDDLET